MQADSCIPPRHPTGTAERPLATAKPWVTVAISRAQWFKLSSQGRTPLPIRLGTRRPVWPITKLHDWLAAGAPTREVWLRMRGAQR
jgi:predicted DNA-binding transcriptional regulator AlpA